MTVMSALSLQAHAQVVDVASGPLATSASTTVRANVMFIMDDSGSMSYGYLPDDRNYNNHCFADPSINRIYFNPDFDYPPPRKADGTSYPQATFTSAKSDGFSSSSWSVDLSDPDNLTTKSAQINSSGDQGKVYLATYKANQTPATPDCTSTGFDWSKWDLVTDASTLSAAQRQKYANWYSYYRTRMLAMRSSVGHAMARIDASRFRIGYSAISNSSYTSSAGFLPVGNFDGGTQKSDFYTKLYGAAPSGWTPLRPALERVGKYYAKRQLDGTALPTGVADPVQYSCQRNYAILTTDGYWNRSGEPTSYLPTKLDGTEIGNQDGGSTLRPMLDDGTADSSGNWIIGGAGVSNSLADIAMYFYQTDLRNGTATSSECTGALGLDVCTNNVHKVGVDDAKHQHMTTFALGLGVAGDLNFTTDYEIANGGDFAALRNGTRPWPNPRTDSWDSVVSQRADDLWHAAVNGRGRYYSAASPVDLVNGMTNALDAIASVTGSAAAAATSSLQPISGDNFVYLGQYTTSTWDGNIKAMYIHPVTGAMSPTPMWEAKNTVRAQTSETSDTRKIYFRLASRPKGLEDFEFDKLDSAGHGAHFEKLCPGGVGNLLTQCADVLALGATATTSINSGASVVNYLRGQRGLERRATKDDATAVSADDKLFRFRERTPLGDIVNAAPVYVKVPPFRYTDTGYLTFTSNNETRRAMLYVAANDGMLHAFDGLTGEEVWAYVPTAVMPNLHKLADADYGANHRYFVDGTPTIGDVYDTTNNKWRTILIGGLNSGGRAYYALDVTDPANPESLWEISNSDIANLGFTYGNPLITKNSAGTWVVAFTSGYNNHTSGGDGNGHLYIRDALTGAAIDDIATGSVGTTTSPSNLGKITAWIETETNNTAARIYGGDMKGNVWRFDYDNQIAPTGKEATLLARTVGPSPTLANQPITTAPVLAKVKNGTALVNTVTVATGRYIGLTDITDTAIQSLYVFKDDLSTAHGALRSNTNIVSQTFTETTTTTATTRTMSTNAVNWATKIGWYVDFTAGERVNVDLLQTNGYLGVATNIPTSSTCDPGGKSWLYTFGLGGTSTTTPGSPSVIEAVLDDAMVAGLNLIQLGDYVRWMRWDVKGNPDLSSALPGESTGTAPQRASWRELIN